MFTNKDIHSLSDKLTDSLTNTLADKLSARINRPMRLIKTAEVLDRVCISNSQLYRKLKEGTFPLPKISSPAGRAWLESDIDYYLANLENDEWHLYLARQEKKAATGKAGMERKAKESASS